VVSNFLWVLLYIALLAGVGGAAYYVGDDRGEERGRQEAALSGEDAQYFDASVAKLTQLGYTWSGSAWLEPSAPAQAAGGGATTSSLPDRTSCAEIDGTPYRSLTERTFFLTSCVDGAAAASPTTLCGAPPNPWCYDLFPGELIDNPPGNFCDYFECVENFWVGTGYVIRCGNDTYSKAGGTSDACSGNGGVLQPLFSH
jgi:hypothetical protein